MRPFANRCSHKESDDSPPYSSFRLDQELALAKTTTYTQAVMTTHQFLHMLKKNTQRVKENISNKYRLNFLSHLVEYVLVCVIT